MKSTSLTLLVAAAASAASPATAQFVNGSFEEPALIAGSFSDVPSLPGWSRQVGGTIGVWSIPTGNFFTANAPDGQQIFYSNSGSIAQQTSNPIVVGTQTVTVQAGRRGDGFAGDFRMTVFAGGTVAGGLITGGTVLGSVVFDHTSIPANSFAPLQFTYTALAGDSLVGQLLGVQFVRIAGLQMNFDHVVLSGDIVPEPATAAILAGLLGLGAAALRRQRR